MNEQCSGERPPLPKAIEDLEKAEARLKGARG